MAARSGATNAPHLRPRREPSGRRNKSAAWPGLPQLRYYSCHDSDPPARPRPALLERTALANPHDDRGSRILDIERRQNGDDGRLVPPEEHTAGTAQASIALAPRSHPFDRGDVRPEHAEDRDDQFTSAAHRLHQLQRDRGIEEQTGKCCVRGLAYPLEFTIKRFRIGRTARNPAGAERRRILVLRASGIGQTPPPISSTSSGLPDPAGRSFFASSRNRTSRDLLTGTARRTKSSGPRFSGFLLRGRRKQLVRADRQGVRYLGRGDDKTLGDRAVKYEDRPLASTAWSSWAASTNRIAAISGFGSVIPEF